MLLVTIDDVPGGSAGARLASGEILHLGRAARTGSVEAWLPNSVKGILEGGLDGLRHVKSMVERHETAECGNHKSVLPATTNLLSPIPAPGLVLAAGLAYRSHLAEMSGTPVPQNPTAFLKAPSSISGPSGTVQLPPQAPCRVDFEGELAVVVGRECHNVSPDDAMDFVAGFTVANDLSARDWVEAVWRAEKPWDARQTWEINLMGKQLPGFTALGPALLTVDSVDDIESMGIVTRLNGTVMQEASFSDMLFPVAQMLSYFSRWYTFRPGDVLLTGTPAGVGVGRKPPVFLKAGDRLEVTVHEIGTLTTDIRAVATAE
jgi:acylpyruvate hydrolase